MKLRDRIIGNEKLLKIIIIRAAGPAVQVHLTIFIRDNTYGGPVKVHIEKSLKFASGATRPYAPVKVYFRSEF